MMIELSDAQWRSIDEELFAHLIIPALKRLRETASCSLQEALQSLPERYGFLRRTCPERFTVRHEDYWQGFVS